MIDPSDVPAVAPNELLARFIYSSRHFGRANRRIKAAAFLPPSNGKESVTRHREATEWELWQIGQAGADTRGQTLYGRGDVLAATCGSQGLSIEADPVEGNPNHANVVGWPLEDKAACKLIAEEIALAAKFVATPAQ
jgi:hypothetical protein